MKGKIAVVLDGSSQVSTLSEGSSVAIFEKNTDFWEITREIPVDFSRAGDMRAVREEINSLAGQLQSCKIIAGKKISGIIYNVFDRLGFSIFEIDAVSPPILDSISRDIEEEKNKTAVSALPESPVETDIPGYYYLDLIALQSQNPGLSSKKALRPFLAEKPFISLTLLCSHLPPWLESEPHLSVSTVLSEGKVTATILKKVCKE